MSVHPMFPLIGPYLAWISPSSVHRSVPERMKQVAGSNESQKLTWGVGHLAIRMLLKATHFGALKAGKQLRDYSFDGKSDGLLVGHFLFCLSYCI